MHTKEAFGYSLMQVEYWWDYSLKLEYSQYLLILSVWGFLWW